MPTVRSKWGAVQMECSGNDAVGADGSPKFHEVSFWRVAEVGTTNDRFQEIEDAPPMARMRARSRRDFRLWPFADVARGRVECDPPQNLVHLLNPLRYQQLELPKVTVMDTFCFKVHDSVQKIFGSSSPMTARPRQHISNRTFRQAPHVRGRLPIHDESQSVSRTILCFNDNPSGHAIGWLGS